MIRQQTNQKRFQHERSSTLLSWRFRSFMEFPCSAGPLRRTTWRGTKWSCPANRCTLAGPNYVRSLRPVWPGMARPWNADSQFGEADESESQGHFMSKERPWIKSCLYMSAGYIACVVRKNLTHTHTHTHTHTYAGPPGPPWPPKKLRYVILAFPLSFTPHWLAWYSPFYSRSFQQLRCTPSYTILFGWGTDFWFFRPLRRPIARNKGRYDILRPVGMASGAVVGTVAVGARCAQSRLPGCSSPRFPKTHY